MKKRMILSVFLLVVLSVSAIAADAWIKPKGSFQFVYEDNLDDKGGFSMNRARVGVYGSFLKDTFFEVVLEGKYTQDGDGVYLRKAYMGVNLTKDVVLEAGALMTSFTRAISGTEFSFINYDLTQTPDSYQYGINLRGSLMDKMIYFYFSISNGEGLTTENVGNGLLFMGRAELQLMGRKSMTDGVIEKFNSPSLTISAAAAYDVKSGTDDSGVSYYNYSGTYFLTDVTFKINYLSFFAQGVYNFYEAQPSGLYWGGLDSSAKESKGGYAQLGYNLKGLTGMSIEPTVKYEKWIETINVGYGDQDVETSNFALAVNWYLKGHYCKLTAEYRKQLTNDWENPWMLRKPDKQYLGFRLTYKFTGK